MYCALTAEAAAINTTVIAARSIQISFVAGQMTKAMTKARRIATGSKLVTHAALSGVGDHFAVEFHRTAGERRPARGLVGDVDLSADLAEYLVELVAQREIRAIGHQRDLFLRYDDVPDLGGRGAVDFIVARRDPDCAHTGTAANAQIFAVREICREPWQGEAANFRLHILDGDNRLQVPRSRVPSVSKVGKAAKIGDVLARG